MQNDLVSIIMPAYNSANYIAESIESVQIQTHKNWELLIIDDCSNDNTIELVTQYAIKDSRIRLFQNKKNSGAAVSRNYALREAKGKWIAFLDSDDIWLPEKLSKQISFMKRNNYLFSYTNYCEIDENGNHLSRKVTGPKTINKTKMFHYCYPGCLTVMYDAENIGLIQIKDIKKNNDYAMWLKICQKADCWLLDECLANYRKRGGSISRHNISTMIVWHYKLWHEAECKNVFISLWYTIWNLFYGFWKKRRYVIRGEIYK